MDGTTCGARHMGGLVGSMVVLLAVNLLAARSTNAQAQTPPYTFAGLAWGSGPSTVKQVMASQGLTFEKVDSDGDYRFSGTLVGQKTVVWALMTPQQQLSKVVVDLVTKDQDARSVYRSMKETLIAKYGSPTNCAEGFVSPYYEGDGFEEQAIRLGKGSFFCLWGDEHNGVLGLQITTNLTVTIGYESSGWYAGEADRRKAKGTRAF